MQATDTIIAAGVVVTGSTLIRNAHSGQSKASPIVFGFLMVAGLLTISLVSQGFAKGLAWFSMIGALAVNGPAVFQIAGGLSGTATPPAATNVGGIAGNTGLLTPPGNMKRVPVQ